MRGPWSRRVVDVYGLLVSDRGGHDVCSEMEKSILRRAAVHTVELERLEARFSESEATPTALDLYSRMSGNLRRLLESVGLERVPKHVTTLGSILRAGHHGEVSSG